MMTAIVALWHWPPTKNKGKESSPKQTQIDNRQQIKAKAKAKRNENKTKQIHTHARQRSREFSQDTLERREGTTDRQTDVQQILPSLCWISNFDWKNHRTFFFHYETKQTTDITFLIDRREVLFSPHPPPPCHSNGRQIAKCCHRLP